MDSTPSVTHLGLCAGYGGIELGLKRAIPSLRTVALCEIEAFAIANLVSKMEAGLMDPAPIWPDLKTFPWAAFRDRVDILTGGYPCQPFSAAGKRLGGEDPRHLWPHISRGISILQPRVCFFENVEGHITCGLHHVLWDLGRLGYRTTWGIFSASECGAPHQRKRVFILAYSSARGKLARSWSDSVLCGKRGESSGQLPIQQTGGENIHSERHIRHNSDDGGYQAAWPSRPGEQQYRWEPPRVVADSHRLDRSAQAEGRQHDRQAGPAGEELGDAECIRRPTAHRDSAGMGSEECQKEGAESESGTASQAVDSADDGWRQTQPPLGGNPDGSAGGLDYAELCVTCDNRTDELRLLGNGVVPATAERAFRTLMRELDTDQPVS